MSIQIALEIPVVIIRSSRFLWSQLHYLSEFYDILVIWLCTGH